MRIARICRTHGKPLTEDDLPRCPEGHNCHTWHVADTRTGAVIHQATRRGEKLEADAPPAPPKKWCAECRSDRDVIMRYIDVRSNRKVPVCGVCGGPMPKGRSKYGNIPTKDITGKIRPSRRESRRGNELYMLQRTGQIRNLRFCNDAPRQRFPLDVYGNVAVDKLLAALAGLKPYEKLVEDVRKSLTHITTYTPDFTYNDKGGFYRVEDSKGFKTRDYRLVKKIMKAVTGIDILES